MFLDVKTGSVGATGIQRVESFMLLNILQSTGPSPQQSYVLAQNDNSAEVKKPDIKNFKNKNQKDKNNFAPHE